MIGFSYANYIICLYRDGITTPNSWSYCLYREKDGHDFGYAIWQFFFSFNYIITHILGLIYSDIFFVYAEDIIKMSKKKNPGGKKPPRQPVNILTCWSTLLHLCSMWKFVNYPSFLHRSKNAHSRMPTLLKGMPKFNGSWNLDRPSDKYVAMPV